MLSTATREGDAPVWEHAQTRLRRCENHALGAGCNWLVGVDAGVARCSACALNRTIPNLASDENRTRWANVEAAKRRLLYGLGFLGLSLQCKADDAEHGLAFDFVAPRPDAPVLTGHAAGLITLNIDEADPVERERARTRLNEPYRTLLGHFRHEIGHYYFEVLTGEALRPAFRACFGDEREDYAAALARQYDAGPPDGWQNEFISSYASAHPLEDWAEVFAHYLHVVDALETAFAQRLLDGPPDAARERSFDAILVDFQALSVALNEMNRSLGQRDAYPFAVTNRVRDKLAFVHDAIRGKPQQVARGR